MKNDFEIAYDLIKRKLTEKEKREILKSGTDIEKTAVILNMVSVSDDEIANLLIDNLTNQSGPVREAVAFNLEEFMPD